MPVIKYKRSIEVSSDYTSPVVVRYVASIASGSLFENTRRMAVLVVLANLYQFREGMPSKVSSETLAYIQKILSPYRRIVV